MVIELTQDELSKLYAHADSMATKFLQMAQNGRAGRGIIRESDDSKARRLKIADANEKRAQAWETIADKLFKGT